MRLELSGSLLNVDPIVVKFNEDGDFDALAYKDLGYTHFDVICIGAGGGRGGGIDTANTGTSVVNYGGEGGGGGFCRARGLLGALPDTCPVVVGAAGAPGASHDSSVGLVTDGGDGGLSSFNDGTCQSSGGKGGKRVQSNSTTVGTVADGGEGGLGNRTTPGGGAAGGQAGIPTDTGPGTPGTDGGDGNLEDDMGAGGGGGAGGVGKYGSGGTTCVAATAGGRGAYNPNDVAVYGPGSDPSEDGGSGSADVVPGRASGAKASPLNGLPTVYGQSGMPGTVIIRLSRQ
jgi:hypothetical protein